MEAEEILAEAGSKEAASIVASLGALDVLEVFSPQRVTKELKRFGMRDGAAVDLEEMKPDGSERWNLDRPEDQKEVLEMIQVEEPWLLTSSPPCTTFSPLRNVSNGKRDPGVVQEEEELGKARMRTAMKACVRMSYKVEKCIGMFIWWEVYPKELVEAILRGLRKELRERGEISAVEEQLSGPTPDEYVEQEELYKEEFGQFVDDVTGTELPAHLVKAARKEELGWLHKEGVYVKVPRRICEGKGMKPLQLKWLDINKGDATQVKVRSRLVAKEVFQGDYIGWLKEHGAEFCALCPAIFKIAERRLIGLVHGDDFMVKGNGANLQWLDGVLNTRYTARLEAMLGRGAEDDKEMFFLNRKIRFKLDDAARWKLELEADARHAEIVMRYFGFNEKTKGVDIPEEKMRDAERVAEERLPELDAEQAVDYRSMVMRLAYLSQDRPDLGHAVKVLSSAMRSPKQGDMQRLKRVARYLVKVPYLKKIFKQQPMREMEVRAWSDSDWAGDPLTRKSVTGAVIKNGGHTLMVRGVTQKIVALSSCESEYYGMCRTATLAEFVRNVMAFYMGEKVPVVKMLVDSSAAKAMTERRGVGKTRHVQARYLWLQDRVAEKALRVEKTPGAVNDADVVTKVLSGGVMRGHLTRMGFEASDNKGHKALFF
ncbi:unnamed protein product [Effrenium voratum]|uniref:Reverse transcriptase Ty1/copia-type domain-containing protein n=1 Tax=Effrenium voratum TaxID=2562239 RepID=A0AA36N570_9DINO|nr:unnamed protein product [Effrenium voratum]